MIEPPMPPSAPPPPLPLSSRLSRWARTTRSAAILFIAGSLAAAGLALRPVEAPAWAATRARQPEVNLERMQDAVGQGILLGTLGGFRSLAANLIWVQGHVKWVRDDEALVPPLLKLACHIDPRPIFFWLNTSRIIAIDMPAWRIEATHGLWDVPDAVRDEIVRRYALEGLGVLAEAEVFHPDNPTLLMERAALQHRRLSDTLGAADTYRQAAMLPGAPWTAARMATQMLLTAGREAEALEWMKAIYPQLPDNEPMAMKWVIHDRIRELEDKLQVPEALRFPMVRGTQFWEQPVVYDAEGNPHR